MSEVRLTGGCQCGAVRFRAGRLGKSAICHCRMCQKAYGSYFGPLVVAFDVVWTRGAPKYFRSSNWMQRGFCAECGTPLCCLDEDGMIELAGGAFDDPSVAAPTIQYSLPSKLPLFDTLHTLERQPHEVEEPYEAKIVSYQHPDHDTDLWPPTSTA
jgi:hypothetical protein